MSDSPRCHDCPEPVDPACTKNFDDIGQPPVYFCRECHDRAMSLWGIIEEALDSGKVTYEQVQAALDLAEKTGQN